MEYIVLWPQIRALQWEKEANIDPLKISTLLNKPDLCFRRNSYLDQTRLYIQICFNPLSIEISFMIILQKKVQVHKTWSKGDSCGPISAATCISVTNKMPTKSVAMQQCGVALHLCVWRFPGQHDSFNSLQRGAR